MRFRYADRDCVLRFTRSISRSLHSMNRWTHGRGAIGKTPQSVVVLNHPKAVRVLLRQASAFDQAPESLGAWTYICTLDRPLKIGNERPDRCVSIHLPGFAWNYRHRDRQPHKLSNYEG